jgi:hypothetical protein
MKRPPFRFPTIVLGLALLGGCGGDVCIARNVICRQPPGCACNGGGARTGPRLGAGTSTGLLGPHAHLWYARGAEPGCHGGRGSTRLVARGWASPLAIAVFGHPSLGRCSDQDITTIAPCPRRAAHARVLQRLAAQFLSPVGQPLGISLPTHSIERERKTCPRSYCS